MMNFTEILNLWSRPLIYLGAGLLLGVIADLIAHKVLLRAARKTAWKGDEVIVHKLSGKLVVLGLIVGALAALPTLPMRDSMHDTLVHALHVAFIFVVTWAAAGIGSGLIAVSTEDSDWLASSSIFRLLLALGIWAVGLTVALNELGISIAPLLTALGVGGLAVALAMQDTLSNLFAGIQILLAKQLKAGDFVRLESGDEGYVVDINWRNTTIRELANNLIVIPNSKLAASVSKNLYLPDQQMSVLVQVGVHYNSDLDHVERVTIEIAREVQQTVEGAIRTHEPFIRYHTFSDSSINFSVILRAEEPVAQYIIKHTFIKKLHQRYRDEGIEIPFPQRVITMVRDDGAGDSLVKD